MGQIKAILVAVDGSPNSDRAVRHSLDMVASGFATEVHFLNVQPSLRGAHDVRGSDLAGTRGDRQWNAGLHFSQ